MTPEQREALQKSIEHWDENVARAEHGLSIVLGPEACACCRIWLDNGCKGCPIFVVTGLEYCIGTFYWIMCKMDDVGGDLIEACKLERDWLKLIVDSEVDDDG